MSNINEYCRISKTADKQRLRKLEAIRELGINPYPHNYKQTAFSKEINEKYSSIEIGEKKTEDIYSISGRIVLRRKMGKAEFMVLQDNEGKVQIYLQKPELTELERGLISNLDLGDIIGVKGYIFKTQTGEVTLFASEIQILCKSIANLPDKYHGLQDTDLKYRNRFIDLITNEDSKKAFRARSTIITSIRRFLDDRGFMEVETPTLQPIYGGAAACPFSTHHNALDMELFMRIAPELYLKKLIVGGFDKVYEIGKNFRNEGVDTTHNPEFTAIEWYEAYTDYEYQMTQVEQMIENAIKLVNGGYTKIKYKEFEVDLKAPWRRLSIADGLRQYAKVDPNTITKEELIVEIKKYKKKKVEEKKSRGELLLELFEETCEEHLIEPTFVIDYPVETSPLTKMHRRDAGVVERFEAFCCRMEIANCYTELNDPVDQGMRLKEQEANREFDEEAQPMDKNFLHAVEIGMPPLGGVGIGVDRIVMLMTGNASIRDVVLFPTLKNKEEK